ncbi:MAG TPA: hypothetical protein VMX75_14610 [Spirochaetia bacterium]|nr:hypothetical protein [Spirochaetia bacterium]
MRIKVLHILFFLLAINLFPVSMEDLGLKILEEGKSDGKTSLKLADSAANVFTVVFSVPVSDETWRTVVSIKDGLWAWKDVDLASVKFVVTEKEMEIVVMPLSYVFRGRDIKPYMHSGMNFFYSDYLTYDFRMVKDNLFLRMFGRWINEEEFGKKMVFALDNPLAYIQAQSPDYFAAKLVEHDKSIDNLLYDSEQQKKSIAKLESSHAELSRQFQEAVAYGEQVIKEATRKYEDLLASHQTLEQKHADLQRAYNELETAHRDLIAKYEEHVGFFERLRYAMLFEHNNFLSFKYQIDKEAISAAVQLKKENPGLTKKDMEKLVKEKGYRLSGKEISLIYEIYFNEL